MDSRGDLHLMGNCCWFHGSWGYRVVCITLPKTVQILLVDQPLVFRVLQVIIAIVFIVKLVSHMNPGPSGGAAAEPKHEMVNVATQPQQVPMSPPVQQGYPVPTQTPGPYAATPQPPQWPQSPPPPHPQQGGQY